MKPSSDLEKLFASILGNDTKSVLRILATQPSLASAHIKRGATRANTSEFFIDEFKHYLYDGDTALHVAAFAYRYEIADLLAKNGAKICAKNRRGAQAIHYACDGSPNADWWNPEAQLKTVSTLIKLGANPDCVDNSGVAPLHRAVRNRCTAAVKALLENGADVNLANASGSTAILLASLTTGKSGSGTEASRIECAKIIELINAAKSS